LMLETISKQELATLRRAIALKGNRLLRRSYETDWRWCKKCQDWYPKDVGTYCPRGHKMRSRPRAPKFRTKCREREQAGA